MVEESKQFIFALEQCRHMGGMRWFGKVPKEIIDLFDLKISESTPGFYLTGMYIETKPQYEAFKPEWSKDNG